MNMTTRFRKMLEKSREEIVIGIGAHTPLYAIIAEKVGAKLIYMSGACVSMEKGYPDVGLITMTEMVENLRNIAYITNTPVFADADNGYGNAINVMRTVKAYIRAGAAGCHIEDQVTPKRCGHLKGKVTISKEEMIGKIKAAKKVIMEEDPDFVLVARTDARGAVGGGIDETIKRVKLYAEAGADVVFPDALLTKEEIKQVVKEANTPILFHPTGVSPRLSIDECKELGVAIVIYPLASLHVAAVAVWNYLHDLVRKGTQAQIEFEEEIKKHPLKDLRKLFELTGLNEVQKYEKLFLPERDFTLRYEKSIGL